MRHSYTYAAFGSTSGQTGSTENSYQFAGEQFDESLGEYYLRQRYYDTATGRFTRRDTYEGTLNNPLTLHKYLYANSNPINYVDPSGKVSIGVGQQIAILTALAVLQDVISAMPVQAPINADDSHSKPLSRASSELAVVLLIGGIQPDDLARAFPRGSFTNWNFWDHLLKVEVNGISYASINGRLFTQHAIERMLPRGLGVAARRGGVVGRGYPLNLVVEEILANGVVTGTRYERGALRVSRTLGDVTVVTEIIGPTGQEVVTTIRHVAK
ncbi:MAG: RHS repeat-associated core domain-containing protein [Oculatellaceae cyanobacterium bins.114]|nr:RHS repeat-associated core domain-containing protein [Oculatellaceae cyanobacterium bins.114]